MAKVFGIEVKTDRFDQRSALPMDINAGNRFYGSDFAVFLKEQLKLPENCIIDEDWGWLVIRRAGDQNIHYGISDWHDNDESFGERPVNSAPTEANWYVVVSACRSARWLGLIPYEKAVDCPASYGEELVTIFAAEGIHVLRAGIE